MSDNVNQSQVLKQALHAFVLDAEGDLATALEQYSADQLKLWSATNLQGTNRSNLAIDMFLTEGQVAGQSVLDIFIKNQPGLSQHDKALAESWKNTFNGLFKVLQVTTERYEVMNWLTEKCYWVEPNGAQSVEELARLSPNEIVVTRLSPNGDDVWTFSGPLMLLGKLGKPKLAVAIGNFKNWFPGHLYGDAPELLAEAWKSVERYHHDFVDFFGSDRITLSGYELNKKLKEYQEISTQRRLEAIGIDSSKSLKELVAESGVSEEEMAESMASFGKDSREVGRLLKDDKAIKMATPPINLPDELRRAEAVTVFVHPRWGQTFLKDYVRLTQLFEATDDASVTKADQLIQKYLKDDAVNAYVWRCFAEDNATPLMASLGRQFNRSDLTVDDLDNILMQAGKPLEPKLPEIASVPMHLQDLFQAAMQEVDQGSSKKKSKGKQKQKTGFAV
ncbi:MULTISPECIES: hypothetical protein [Cyanophyceae]|uniref:hypothetical protein n=1 Tax=Cyanophyceae TaxID=3028117 RepID=UPI00168294C4|nr:MULTISPECIES: hypothetical protein [Cyanophyceae]MBD1917377.1 hypothetical protein [Phormidium sp. FACHB-77]MBD2032378.1 hypothetical protein [Phormidium sp. FACHB-322]MBD2052316.1 hypothetical protein [Leptolyngbya sp. FACHB-60]